MHYSPATSTEPAARNGRGRDVLVIGGGASGVIFAANLLRESIDFRVTVIEGRHGIGRGIAYSTQDPDHLLNTRVCYMSAFHDDPDHFLNWLEATMPGQHDRESFVGRGIYGDYLSGLLDAWVQSGRLVKVRAECVRLTENDGGVTAVLDDGRQLQGGYAMLATGHVVPKADPSGLIEGAWSIMEPAEAGETSAEAAPVLIIGTGLSMVDQVLSAERAGLRRQIIAISRRGLLPLSHSADAALQLDAAEVPLGQPLSRVLAWLRALDRAAERDGGSWRAVVDGLRPWVSLFWQAMDTDQRKRFLRHCATWWEIHRHRIPPASAARLQAAMDAGRLSIRRAAFERAERDADGGAVAVIRPRGNAESIRLPVSRIVDCRGIRNDPERNASPLMAGLLADGAVRVDPLRLGPDVSPRSRLIGKDGRPSARIFALGPVARAMFWEITAIPDIRVQAGELARYIKDLPG